MLFEFFQLIKGFFAIFCLKYGLVKAIFYGMMQCSKRQKCHFWASNFKNFLGGGPRILLQSDFKLDPPQTDICKNEIYLLSSSVLKRNVVSTLYNNTG